MSRITEKSPENITVRGQEVPAWFVDEGGRRFDFEGVAVLDDDGCFELSQLTQDQCILSPGVIYQLHK